MPPTYVREFALLHWLKLIDGITENNGARGATLIRLRAEGTREINRLLSWFNEGEVRLASAARGEVYQLLSEISSKLSCPLIISSELPRRSENTAVDRLEEPASFIHSARLRLLRGIVEGDTSQFLDRVPRIPLTKEETKERLRLKSERDELKGVAVLAPQGSISGNIFVELGLTRGVIKMAMRDLIGDRR